MRPFLLRNMALITLVLVGLGLAACTRSASGGAVPTATSGVPGTTTTGGVEQDPTMAALGTTVASQMTATAIAQGAGGGGEVVVEASPTPIPPEAATPTAPAVQNPTATPVPAGASCPNPYPVKQGDWIYKIARECKVEPSAIIAANPGINPNFIQPGQLLNMPAAGATAVPPATPQACTGTHTVVKGENLFRIAYGCGLATEDMALFNGIPYPYTIYPGQVLKFP